MGERGGDKAWARMFRVLFFVLALTASSKSLVILPGYQFDCPGPGLWSDPANCQCYYNCANNIAYHDCCPPDDLFDDDKHICDFDDNVNCGDRPGPGSTTPARRSTTPAGWSTTMVGRSTTTST